MRTSVPLHMHLKRNRDSTTTNFQLVHFEAKQTTGPEFYDRSNLSRRVGLVGLSVAALFGVSCICAGVMIPPSQNPNISGIVVVSLSSSWDREVLCLGLNLVVTACTEATGFAHGIALRSTLASERRLHFNTNLRLLSASDSFLSPNGTLVNILMAILLVISYGSSLLVTLSVNMDSSSGVTDTGFAMCVSEIPLIVLGGALVLQAAIALASVFSADILTWSSSPFDITAALVHHAQILPESGRCMHGVGDRRQEPVKPSAKQSSAWGAHQGVRKVVMRLWLLVVVCVTWGVIIVYISDHNVPHAVQTWTFFPQAQSQFVAYTIPLEGSVYWYWLLYYVNMAVIQGPLTMALHCSELIVNVVRDEGLWRRATMTKGMTISSHPLALVFGRPLNFALLLLKPILHWMLGLAISLAGTASLAGTGGNGYLEAIAVRMWAFQIINYSAALLILSLTLTVIVLLRPSGPQPAAYGHIQTLANLIDEWSPTMWWGHKRAGHAGTSNARLATVDMNELYG